MSHLRKILVQVAPHRIVGEFSSLYSGCACSRSWVHASYRQTLYPRFGGIQHIIIIIMPMKFGTQFLYFFLLYPYFFDCLRQNTCLSLNICTFAKN